MSKKLDEILYHPNPYNFRPDISELTFEEQSAFVWALDGYGLRDMLIRKWGKEKYDYFRSIPWNWVPDPLELIQEIP